MKNWKTAIAAILACVFIFSIGFSMGSGKNINIKIEDSSLQPPVAQTQTQPQTQTQAPVEITAIQTDASTTSETQKETTEPVAEITTGESSTQKPAEVVTEAPTQPPVNTSIDVNKKGDLVKSVCSKKIWAGILGECYIVLRNIDEKNEWEEKGKVYELHVTYVKTGEEYSMWSDGYWELSDDCTTLTLKPVNQSQNGNIGCEAGEKKVYTASNGVFEIPISFEQGGKTTIYMDLAKDAL